MKNKLTKNNKKKFDYTMRKLGVVSMALTIMTFSFVLPIYQNVKNDNHILTQNIEVATRHFTHLQKVDVDEIEPMSKIKKSEYRHY